MVERCISGGLRSRSGLPKLFVLLSTCCSLIAPQFPQVAFTVANVVMGPLSQQREDRLAAAEPHRAINPVPHFRVRTDAQAVVVRGRYVPRADRIGGRIGGLRVGSTMNPAALDPTAGYDHGVDARPMV